MNKYVDMLENIKIAIKEEIDIYPIEGSNRRNLLGNYYYSICDLQDKIIPGSSDKKCTIEWIKECKKKYEKENINE